MRAGPNTSASFTEVNAAIGKAVADGFITHAYAAYGSLAKPAPTFVHAHTPDGRDIFDLASLTKALVTTPLVFERMARDEVTLDMTIGAWLAGKNPGLPEALTRLTVRSLLSHRSGLPAWRNFWVCELGIKADDELRDASHRRARLIEVLERVAREPASPPAYSDVGFLLLGLVLEITGGADLAVQFEAFCRKALKLEAFALPLTYGPRFATQPAFAKRMVPTSYCAVRERKLVGEVHDENCASLGGLTAHAGLFGTGGAVAMFLHALAQSRVGQQLLEANAKARHLPPGTPPNEALLGWRQGADPSSAPFGNGGAMGHLGFTGTAFWVCPERRDYAIFLTNRVQSGRTRPGIQALRRDVFGALALSQS